MSSNYHILCLSHDPALVIDRDYGTPEAALRDAARPHKFADHAGCDLLVGRYSAPLIEVACPGGKRCSYHNETADTWIDASWLRFLHNAYSHGHEVGSFRLPRCWTRDRVLRLGAELGVETQEVQR